MTPARARARLLRPFPPREVRPGGWVADRMREDLVTGFVGHLDRLAPDLVVEDDIFGRDRLTAGVAAKDLGAFTEDHEWTAQFLWWNAETQGNWRDGWLRHCLWVGDAADRGVIPPPLDRRSEGDAIARRVLAAGRRLGAVRLR